LNQSQTGKFTRLMPFRDLDCQRHACGGQQGSQISYGAWEASISIPWCQISISVRKNDRSELEALIHNVTSIAVDVTQGEDAADDGHDEFRFKSESGGV
jgi:hypothetical protein